MILHILRDYFYWRRNYHPSDEITITQRMRREAVNTMQLTCDGLFKLFHTQDPLLGWLRNTGLSLTQHLPLIKRQLAKQAIGF